MLPGVYQAYKKDGTPYFRSNLTHQGKHISLGSFPTEIDAHGAYCEGSMILSSPDLTIDTANQTFHTLTLEKCVSLFNFRDNKLYIHTPIYLRSSYFEYYMSWNEILKFDIEDLFYFSSHKIQKRGGHLFVSEYGMQTSLSSRYGIKNYAVRGKDYDFANSDPTDYRYSNLIIRNTYHGVERIVDQLGNVTFRTKIHIRGLVTVGNYPTVEKAAVAYNKAADYLHKRGFSRAYQTNYIESMSPAIYASCYNEIHFSKTFIEYAAGII